MVINSDAFDMGPDPAPSPIPGIPEETQYLGEKLDAILHALEHPPASAAKPAPGNYFCMPGARNDFPQQVRLRTTELFLSVSLACVVTVRRGAAIDRVFEFAGPTTASVSYIDSIDRGTDVSVAVSAGVLRTAYFVGTPDEAEPANVQQVR